MTQAFMQGTFFGGSAALSANGTLIGPIVGVEAPEFTRTVISTTYSGSANLGAYEGTFADSVNIDEDDEDDEDLCQGGCGEKLEAEALSAGRDICFDCYTETEGRD